MRKRIVWHLEVPQHLDNKLESLLKSPNSDYRTKSEFIRDAVRIRINAIYGKAKAK